MKVLILVLFFQQKSHFEFNHFKLFFLKFLISQHSSSLELNVWIWTLKVTHGTSNPFLYFFFEKHDQQRPNILEKTTFLVSDSNASEGQRPNRDKGKFNGFWQAYSKKGLDNPKLVNLKELLGQELYK